MILIEIGFTHDYSSLELTINCKSIVELTERNIEIKLQKFSSGTFCLIVSRLVYR